MEQEFHTPEPARLNVAIGSGTVRVEASATDTTTVSVTGRDADQTRVEQNGRQIDVVGPHRGPFGDRALHVVVRVPEGSDVGVKTGSADVDLTGRLANVMARTGSGEIGVELATGPMLAETGSGTIRIGEAGAELRIKSGSGDVSVGTTQRTCVISTGSGDVELGTVHDTVSVKTGSGSLRVAVSDADVQLSTGSGDVEIGSMSKGRLTGKGASSDIRIGVPAGVPVWTDLTTVSGKIRSTLQPAGQPREGQDHVELRARTVSGDIVLVER